jgi:hypothetical protein
MVSGTVSAKGPPYAKCPLVPYVPEKDPVQETVSALKDQSLKTTTMIGEDTALHLSIWHTRMRKAFLMHVGSTLDAIKKQGHFKAYKEAQELYVKQHKTVKLAKAALAELDRATGEGAENTKEVFKEKGSRGYG